LVFFYKLNNDYSLVLSKSKTVYCNKLELTSLNGLIASILIANKERLNFVFNKKNTKESSQSIFVLFYLALEPSPALFSGPGNVKYA